MCQASKHSLFNFCTAVWTASGRDEPCESWKLCSRFNTSWFKWSTRVKCSRFHSRSHLTSPPAPVCLSHQSALRMCQPHMVPIQPGTKGEYGRHQALSPQLSPLGLSIVWERADDQNDQNQVRIFKEALTATLRETSEFNSRKKYHQGQIKSYPMLGNWP